MVTQESLKDIFSYNPDDGLFTRAKKTSASVFIGDIASCVNCNGYMVIRIEGVNYQAHRLAWLYMYGEWPDGQIDHINHDRTDNRLINLRTVSQQENTKNRSISSNNKSGITGVCWSKRWSNWRVQISNKKKNIALGHFSDKFEAVCARKSAENKYGYHTNHGR